MKYNYRTGVVLNKKRSPLLVILPVFGLMVGGYILFNALSPSLPTTMAGDIKSVSKRLTQRQPNLDENRLYVPKIGVDISIVEGVDESSLEGGAWHRLPQNGDPLTGGNFVLAAHRFNLGFTPDQTRAKSPFYHIDKLQDGDEIYVDYDGVRYAYEVVKKYKVPDSEVGIENRSSDSKLTMYSCDLGGPEKGREVIEAHPIGTIAWSDGAPKLKRLQ